MRDGEEYGTPTTTFHANLKYVDDDGNVQAEGFNGQVLQVENTQLAQHWGFSSRPPEDTFLYVLKTASSERIVHENVWDTSLTKGESKFWASDNKHVYLKSDGTIEVKAKTTNDLIKLLGACFLGSATASEALVKGTTQASAFTTYMAAWMTFMEAWKTALSALGSDFSSDPDSAISAYCSTVDTEIDTMVNAMAIFTATIATWTSNKHKLDS